MMVAAVTVAMIPLAAQAMTVDQFLAKANALKAKGMMAMLSSDIGVLKAEIAEATSAWKADKAARKAAGKAPLACAPEGTKMTSDDLLKWFAALPPAQRAASVKDGFARVVIAHYPCQ
jgi:spore germination cell wall hydrolase CwlJ-like protein